MCAWALTQKLLTRFAKFAEGFFSAGDLLFWFFVFFFNSWKKLVKLGNVCSGFPSFLIPAASSQALLRSAGRPVLPA